MRYRTLALCCIFSSLVAGCLPVKSPSLTAPPASPPVVSPVEAGLYWHQASAVLGPADALSYYAALKVLTSDELALEHQRLRNAFKSSDNRLAHLQLVLLACLPGQTLVDGSEAVKSLEVARQDAVLHRELGDLFILLNDQLASRGILKDQQCDQALLVARKKAKVQSGELATCREQRDELATKLQQLQDIERGLLDRERKH